MYGLPKNVRVVPVIPVSVHLIVPSIGFVYVFVCRKLYPHYFKSLRAGSQVFALLMLSLCIICGQVRACSCYTSCHLICCVCLPSV